MATFTYKDIVPAEELEKYEKILEKSKRAKELFTAEDEQENAVDPTIYAVIYKQNGKVIYDCYCETIEEVTEQIKIAEYWGDSVEVIPTKKSKIKEGNKNE